MGKLYAYWKRFNKLCASCLQYYIYEQLLLQYFYEELVPIYRNMIDATSDMALVNKTSIEAHTLILTITTNS